MNAKFDAIGDRFSALPVCPRHRGSAGFALDHGGEPLLFHRGLRRMLPRPPAAVVKVRCADECQDRRDR